MPQIGEVDDETAPLLAGHPPEYHCLDHDEDVDVDGAPPPPYQARDPNPRGIRAATTPTTTVAPRRTPAMSIPLPSLYERRVARRRRNREGLGLGADRADRTDGGGAAGTAPVSAAQAAARNEDDRHWRAERARAEEQRRDGEDDQPCSTGWFWWAVCSFIGS